jgi:hypothetical protein
MDLLNYWQTKRGDRSMPARAAIDPLEMRAHIGHLILVDVIGSPPRFRYRLIGSEVTRRVGRDSTGKYLDALYSPAVYEAMIVSYEWIVANRRPMRCTGNLQHANREWIGFESIDLPLSDDDHEVNMLITRGVYT